MQNTIAVVFDFDDTLAPDSTTGFMALHGIDTHAFWTGPVSERLAEDWDQVPAYLYEMMKLGKQGDLPLTRDALVEWGKSLPLHEGVEDLFARLREVVARANPTVTLEFYIISSGIGDIVRNNPVAHQFKDIWASELFYDDDGNAAFIKNVVSFTDKTRYLFQIQKGLIGERTHGQPLAVNEKFAPEQLRVPFPHMIFVGDGMTDIPCFSLVSKEKGRAVAVYDKHAEQKWGRALKLVDHNRVASLYSANYSTGSDLCNFLEMTTRNVAEQIAIAQRAYRP